MMSRIQAAIWRRFENANRAVKMAAERSAFNLRGHRAGWAIFTHMTTRERLLLYRLGRRQAPGCEMLEVGSYLGASACFLAAAARDLGKGSRVHCVDTWENQAMTEGRRHTWDEFRRNTKPYDDQIVAHRGLSVDVAAGFDHMISLLFLDGDHSYQGCRADIESWLPHLADGGTLVMHDYGWAEGVQRVVKEIVREVETHPGHTLDNIYWTRV